MQLPSHIPAHGLPRAEFAERLLTFVNHTLPKLERRNRAWTPISSDTPLFATGLLDSMSILHLIGAIEELTGQQVPDQMVVMKHFQTVETICAAFASPTPHSRA